MAETGRLRRHDRRRGAHTGAQRRRHCAHDGAVPILDWPGPAGHGNVPAGIADRRERRDNRERAQYRRGRCAGKLRLQPHDAGGARCIEPQAVALFPGRSGPGTDRRLRCHPHRGDGRLHPP